VCSDAAELLRNLRVFGGRSNGICDVRCADFERLGDAHSGIAAAYGAVLLANGSSRGVAAGGAVSFSALVAALSAPGLSAGVTCLNISTPRLPGATALRLNVTLVNGAGGATSTLSGVFYARQSVPELTALTIPPQRVVPSDVGALSVRLTWPPASDTQADCCAYTMLVASSPALAAAAAVPVPPGGLLKLPSGALQWTMPLAFAPAGRLFFWLRATNAANGSSTVAAQRSLAVVPLAVAPAAVALLRPGDAAVGELLRGHAANMSLPPAGAVLTLLFTGALPDAVATPALHEGQLTALTYNSAWNRWDAALLSGTTASGGWVPMGLNRSLVLRNVSVPAGATRLQGAVRLTLGSGQQRLYATPVSALLPPGGSSRAVSTGLRGPMENMAPSVP
jgi:hypothetical protein